MHCLRLSDSRCACIHMEGLMKTVSASILKDNDRRHVIFKYTKGLQLSDAGMGDA